MQLITALQSLQQVKYQLNQVLVQLSNISYVLQVPVKVDNEAPDLPEEIQSSISKLNEDIQQLIQQVEEVSTQFQQSDAYQVEHNFYYYG